MSKKEPSPLKALEILDTNLYSSTASNHELEECRKIIETALKEHELLQYEYDLLESVHKNIVCSYNKLLSEKLKDHAAIEIIKRLLHKDGIEKWLYKTENDCVFADFRISEKDYNLLKEVLL